MAIRQRRYRKEDLAQRGQALYDSGIRQQRLKLRYRLAGNWAIA